ncbi:diguanylate cyclase domain-containing protein [Arhodomonas sp. SL1]|uniref:diguanylate cyclase domain-containing protein n=1 Tax=Arhodomonas sp. SL1 TaxID=3425691 RepID=UPI003F8859E2
MEAATLGPEGDTTISAGTAAWRGGDTAAVVIERADSALYAAKQAGRNCCIDADAVPPESAAR